MDYEWYEKKRQANIARHGVDFMDAEWFEWETAMETIDNRFNYDEERWIAMGYIHDRLHVMVYTIQPDIIRIISLRKAKRHECHYYENQT